MNDLYDINTDPDDYVFSRVGLNTMITNMIRQL